MRNSISLLMLASLLFLLPSCMVSESEYKDAVAEKEQLKRSLAEAEAENNALNQSILEVYKERENLLAQLEACKLEVSNKQQTQVKPPETAPKPEHEEFYTVQIGDTLNSISIKTGVTKEKLRELNDIQDDNRIFAGKKLRVR